MFLKISIASLCAALAAAVPAWADESISIRGAPVAAEPVNAAAAQLKKETGLEFRIVTDGGSAGAVAGIGEDVVDVALLSRNITPRELASWPDKHFSEVQFGTQALLIVVPEQVWNSGVHALTRDQIRDLYEGNVKNWKALGGQDRKVIFYNRDARGSAWELFMMFLYDDTRKAPPSDAEVLAEPSDVTTAVEYNGGSISFLEYSAPKPAAVHALGIRLPDGKVVEPTLENIASGRYALARPLVIATPRKPAGNVRRFVEFMLGPTGQSFLKKTGHLSVADLEGK
ncbi:MAG: substrate-binding domain-containing protein [Chthoniobacteraceae bacterium]